MGSTSTLAAVVKETILSPLLSVLLGFALPYTADICGMGVGYSEKTDGDLDALVSEDQRGVGGSKFGRLV